MLDRAALVKRKLDAVITQMCQVSWMFSKQPEKDFSRTKKMPFAKVLSFLLAMEGGTLTSELLKYFGCSAKTASASAFVQQRSKLAPEALPALFDLFVQKSQPMQLYKGFRLLAADGSDILIPSNPEHIASHYPGTFIWMLCTICFSIPIRMPLWSVTGKRMNVLHYRPVDKVAKKRLR